MLQAERAVIGSLLINQNQITVVYSFLRPEMFEEWIFGRIYDEYCKAYEREYQLDYILLIQRLEKDIKVETLRPLLQELVAETLSSAFIRSAAEVVVEAWRRKQIRIIVNKQRKVEQSKDEIHEIVEELQSLLMARTEGITLSKLTADIKDDYFNGRDSPSVKMGVKGLDDIIKNLEQGDVTVIAARPAVGKSAFVIQIAEHLCKDMKVGFFSLEMSRKQIFERFVAHISGISLDRVRFGTEYLHDEKERYEKAVKKLEQNENIMIYADEKGFKCPRTASEIEAVCRSECIDIAIIDYLQLMTPEKTYQGNKAAEVGEISRKVKEASMRLGIHIIALSQMSRSIEYRNNRKPMLSDLRESGAIEQDASNIIFLWNKDENDKARKGCMVAKQRQGDTGELELRFDGAHMTFTLAENKKNEFIPTEDSPFG